MAWVQLGIALVGALAQNAESRRASAQQKEFDEQQRREMRERLKINLGLLEEDRDQTIGQHMVNAAAGGVDVGIGNPLAVIQQTKADFAREAESARRVSDYQVDILGKSSAERTRAQRAKRNQTALAAAGQVAKEFA